MGGVLLVRGKLEEVEGPRNPGEFDSRQYYACRHIYYFMKGAVVEKKSRGYSVYRQFLVSLRERMAKILRISAGEAAPVFEALVLGEKSNLESETKMRYQMAGIIHILAISGLHISVLGLGIYGLLKRLGLGIWLSGMLALVLMLQYGMMTGGGVSAMRAVCMFLLSVGAKILGRIYDMPTALSVAAILIISESPAYLLDGGFWLSFGAVLGVGVVAPRICRIFGAKGKCRKALVSSAAVQMTTLPVMLWFYGEVSVVGIFLNLVVLPTVGVVLVSGVGTVLAGVWRFVFPGNLTAAMVCALPGRGVLAVYDWLCAAAGRISWSTWIGGKPEMWQVVLYYFVFGSAVLCGDMLMRTFGSERGGDRVKAGIDFRNWKAEVKRRFKRVRGGRNIVSKGRAADWKKSVYRITGSCLLCLSVGVLAYHPAHRLRITCLDVGQGDAIVVETPENYVFLIDGGSSSKSGIGQYQLLPFLKSRGISYIDAVFISHTDEDHISGVKEMLGYMDKGLTSVRAGNLILPAWEEPPKVWEELSLLAQSVGMEVFTGRKGDIFRSGDLCFEVLSPSEGASGEEVNEDAIVLELSYGDFRALFTGDIGKKTEEKLLDDLTDIDFLKVAHHGSRYSTSEAFLSKTKPELSVISVGAANTYGHPSPETVKRLKKCGSQVAYTMESGAVMVEVGKGNVKRKLHNR